MWCVPVSDTSENTSLDGTILPLQLLDEEGRVLAVNQAWEDFTGYTSEEAVGTPYAEFVPEHSLSEFRRNMGILFEVGHLEGAPCHIRHKDGTPRRILLFARLSRTGSSTSTRCILLDATSIDEAKRQISESETRFRTIFEVAPTPIVVHDGRTVVLANDAAADFLGYESPEALEGAEIASFVHPDSAPEIAERVKRMMSEDWTAPLVDEKYVRKDGTPVHAQTIASPLTVNGKRLIHVLALDQSEQHKAQNALRESEERFRGLFEASADAIVVHDGKIVLLANDSALRNFRIPADTPAEGQDVTRYIHPDSQSLVMGRVAALMSGQRPHAPIETKLCRSDGTVWEAEAVSSVITLDGRKVMQTTFRDLTERKRTERELSLYREELERLVDERTASLSKARANLTAVTAVVGTTVEMRDPYTAGHQRRVAQLTVAIATAMEMDSERVAALEVAALMHDVGKVLVPAEILSKPTKLTNIEFELAKSHAQAGYDIVDSANLQDPIAEIVYQHHERLDGSGYPRGLTAGSLLAESRVLMVADVFEAMASHRPYRPALGDAAALEELLDGKGTRYDEDVVDTCVAVIANGFTFSEE